MKNVVRRKLFSGETCLGTFITVGNPDIVDVLKQLNFDWLVFDTEHSYLSTGDVKTMLQALGEKVSPIVRIGQIDQYLAKRALDIGSEGILAPLVNSAEEAELLVKCCMYPPLGVRGAGPGRVTAYGMKMKEYFGSANDELLIAVQIETKEALSRAAEIIGTKRVDVGFVGPTDLSISLGVTDRSSPKLLEAMQSVVKTCNDLGKVPGTLAVSPEEAERFLKMGFKFLALASDTRFLAAGAQSFLSVRSTNQ